VHQVGFIYGTQMLLVEDPYLFRLHFCVFCVFVAVSSLQQRQLRDDGLTANYFGLQVY